MSKILLNPNFLAKMGFYGILLMTIIIFGKMLSFEIIDFDLSVYLTENPIVQQGLTKTGLIWALTSMHFNWHPVTWISHMVDVELYGTQSAGYFLTSLIFHCINASLVYIFFKRLTGQFLLSLGVMCFFAIHPMHVEPVVWLAARKDLLACCFGLLTLIQYLRYQETKNNIYLFTSLLTYILSLMSKGTLVTLPVLLLLIDFWQLKKDPLGKAIFFKLLIQKIPYFILAILGLILTFLGQNKAGALQSIEKFSIFWRITNSLVAYLDYIKKFFYPLNLGIYYPSYQSHSLLEILIAIFSLSIISLLSVKLFKTLPEMLFGWLWFLITLFPMIGIIQLGDQFTADRYSYLPYLGLSLMVLSIGIRGCNHFLKSKIALVVIFILFGALSAYNTKVYLNFWKDNESIYRETLEHTNNNYIVHNNLGLVLLQENRPQEAIAEFQKVLQIKPNYISAYFNLCATYAVTKDYGKAILAYEKLSQLDPTNPEIYNNLGVIMLYQERYPEALRYFNIALQHNPNYENAQKNLARMKRDAEQEASQQSTANNK